MTTRPVDGMDGTPQYLIPRMGDLPISNARYSQSAVITHAHAPLDPSAAKRTWGALGEPIDTDGTLGRALAFSPDGSTLALGGAEGEVRLLNPKTGAPAGQALTGHADRIWSVGFSTDGSRLGSVGDDGTVRLWDPTNGEQIGDAVVDQSEMTTAVAFTADGLLLLGPRNGALHALTPDGLELYPYLEVPAAPFTALRVASGSRDPTVVAGTSDGEILIVNPEVPEGLVRSSERHEGAVVTIALSPDRSLVASGGWDGRVRLWDAGSGDPVGDPLTDLDDPIWAVAFNSDGSLLASAGYDGTVGLWDPRSRKKVGRPLRGHDGSVWAVAFSPDGTTLASVGDDGTLRLWADTTDGVAEPLKLVHPEDHSGTRPAEGVLLTHEQSWVMQGIALGELLHSVSLAPGEITQIAVTNHTRSVLQQSVDTASQDEDLTQSGQSASDLHEAEQASASQRSDGRSSTSSSSVSAQAGVGGFLGSLGVSAGGGAAGTSAVTTSYSSSSRNVAHESNQSLHQNATNAANLSRRRHTAAVREVSERDALELQTRVVANYNHMHALTLQYYEVVQVQRLRTRVTDAQRLLFIPMRVIDFSEEASARQAMGRYRNQIIAAARDLGLHAVATSVELLMIGDDSPQPDGDRGLSSGLRNHRLNNAWTRADETRRARDEADGKVLEARQAAETSGDAVLHARDEIRQADDPDLEERARLQRELRIAIQESKAAEDALSTAEATLTGLRREAERAARVKLDFEAVLDAVGHDGATTEAPALDADDLAAIEKLAWQALDDHQLAINRGIWMRLDPSEYGALLEGRMFKGEPLAATLDPTPVTVAGNHVGFRWHHATSREAEDFAEEHLGQTELLEDAVPLPTGGVFGEAVLGEANAAEKIDITRFWNWSDALPPIRPTQIGEIGQPGEEPLTMPTRPEVAAAATDLGPITFPEVASGIPAIAGALSNPDLFRDMSGAKTSAALAQSALELTKDGASTAGDLASSNYRRYLQFQRELAEAALKGGGGGASRTLDPTMAGAALNADGQGNARPTALDGAADRDAAPIEPDGDGPVVEFVEDET